jgi:hypothetical protein
MSVMQGIETPETSTSNRTARFVGSLAARSKRACSKAGKYIHERRLFVLQCLGALSVLIGISSLWGYPVALIVGGVGAVLAVERQGDDSLARTGTQAIRVLNSLVKAREKGVTSAPIDALIKELGN